MPQGLFRLSWLPLLSLTRSSFPTNVAKVPSDKTVRILLLPESEKKSCPFLLTARPRGSAILALFANVLSTEKPGIPVPTKVCIIPSLSIIFTFTSRETISNSSNSIFV